MGQTYDRLAITLDPANPASKEYVVLETQLMIDFGQGQGPKGGVIRVEDGWISAGGAGDARLSGGVQEQGGTFPSGLKLTDDQGKATVEIAAHAEPGPPPTATVHLQGAPASLRMRDAAGNDHALLEGGAGNLWLGGTAADGDIALYRSGQTDNRNTAKATIHVDGQSGSVRFRDAAGNDHALLDGAGGNVWLGGTAADGDIALYRSGQTDNRNAAKATIHLDGQSGSVRFRDGSANDHALLDGAGGNLWLGGKAADGDVVLFKAGETDNRNVAKATIHLDGNAGDILLQNADCAEEFDLAPGADVEAGTVMTIDYAGRLCPTTSAYDRKVAGVVSGAGDTRPGIVLGRDASKGSRVPVALVGRVGCRVEATSAPIEVGDLLTSSPIAGRAMKATDAGRAFGAVVGKALAPLVSGEAVIPILVGLQ